LSASRQQRRGSSLNTTFPHSTVSGNTRILSGVDLRTIPQKIEDLEKEILESKDESTVYNFKLI